MAIVGGGASPSSILSGVTVSGTAASDMVPVASSSSAGAWAYPHGHEFDYVEITSNAGTTTSADVITGNAVTYDGATRIKVEVYCCGLDTGATNVGAELRLYEGASDLGLIAQGYGSAGGQLDYAAYGCRFLTPTAAAHTYKIKLVRTVTAGTATVIAGAGGSGASMPAFLRITKA